MSYRKLIKPILDFVLALILLVIVIPVIVFIATILMLEFSGNPFFIQSRPGMDGNLFKIIKFKTMKCSVDRSGNKLSKEKRYTKIGQMVRKTSLDEIPQLINIIKGEMSIVGPRPLRAEYLPHYSTEQARRHEAKPGMTGWAQVNGRNLISWEERFKLDIWYVDNQSFTLDIKILLITIWKVFKREGINQSPEDTMLPFKGITLNE